MAGRKHSPGACGRSPGTGPVSQPESPVPTETAPGDVGLDAEQLSRSRPPPGPLLEPELGCLAVTRPEQRHQQAGKCAAATVDDDDDDEDKATPCTSAPSLASARGPPSSSSDGVGESPGETSPLLGPRADDEEAPPFLNDMTTGRFWLVFSQVLAVQFMGCFDGTIMASSHPVITSYFGAANSASWLSTAFLLASTAVQPLLGRLSDAVGRKPLFLGCMAVFAVATAGCALATSIESFILARAVCGLGAGGALTLGSIITSDLVPIECVPPPPPSPFLSHPSRDDCV